MSESRPRPILQGIALIVIGLLFLLGNFGAFRPDWEVIFTWMIIVMGVLFWIGYLIDTSRGFLIMPATILIIYGFAFFFIARYPRVTLANMGPVFILAPALGLYLTHLIYERNRSVLITSAVLGVISLIFLLNSVPVLKYIWPILTAALGVYILMNPEKKSEAGGDGTRGL